MVARVVDGLPLVGTMQDDEQVAYISVWSVPLVIIWNFNFQFFVVKLTVRQKCPRISESSENAVPKTGSTIAESLFHRNGTVFIPVSVLLKMNEFPFRFVVSFIVRVFIISAIWSKVKSVIWWCATKCIRSGWPLIIWKILHKNFIKIMVEKWTRSLGRMRSLNSMFISKRPKNSWPTDVEISMR